MEGESVPARLIYFSANATTREQYALRLVPSEPGSVRAGDEER
jgi:hypothetical protein